MLQVRWKNSHMFCLKLLSLVYEFYLQLLGRQRAAQLSLSKTLNHHSDDNTFLVRLKGRLKGKDYFTGTRRNWIWSVLKHYNGHCKILRFIFLAISSLFTSIHWLSCPLYTLFRYTTFVQLQYFTSNLKRHSLRKQLLKTIGFKKMCVLSVSRFLAEHIDWSNKWGFFYTLISKGEYNEGKDKIPFL